MHGRILLRIGVCSCDLMLLGAVGACVLSVGAVACCKLQLDVECCSVMLAVVAWSQFAADWCLLM